MPDAKDPRRPFLHWGVSVVTGMTLVALGCKGGGTGPEALGCAGSEPGIVEKWTLAATDAGGTPGDEVNAFTANPTNSNLQTQWSPSVRIIALGLSGTIGSTPAEIGMNMSINAPFVSADGSCLAELRSAELVLVKNPAGGPGIVPEVSVFQLRDPGECAGLTISSISDGHIAVSQMCAGMREVFINGDPDGPKWALSGSFTALDG